MRNDRTTSHPLAVFGVAAALLTAVSPACQPTSADDADTTAGADVDRDTDAGDARSFPEPSVCEAVCDRVYDECDMEFPEDDRMPYKHQSCYNDCLYGWFDGAESCLRDVECDRRSVISCVRDDDIEEALENPCDRETPWPDEWATFERRVLELTNERRQAGAVCGGEEMAPAPPLEMDPRLRCAARRHSEDMARRGYFAHDSPDGQTPSDRADDVEYDGVVGENISAGDQTPEETVEGWMNSEGHCRNIMRQNFQHLGVGYVPDGGPGHDHLATQVFGDPR